MITASERAARELFLDLPLESRTVVHEWLATGHTMRDALLNSNALGKGELRTPRDARREELWINDKRQAAEHESAHCVAAQALGLDVRYARIANDNSGTCIHVHGTKLENAIVLMAPELWIGRFRRDQFPYGPTGLESDHRGLVKIGDSFILREATDHCIEILKQNRAIVLATADKIEKYGYYLP